MTKQEIVNYITVILRDLEIICNEENFEDEFIQLIDFSDLNYSSDRLDEYYEKITLFADLASHMEVNELIENGFMCSEFECKDRYLLGLKRIFPHMIHILQDIFLFRNTLRIPQYTDMFSRIVTRYMAEMQLKKLRKKKKVLEARDKQISNQLLKGGLLKRELELNNYALENTHKDIDEWTINKRNNGIEAGQIRQDILSLSNSQTQDMIRIPLDEPERSKIRKMLFQVIYLRSLDNYCNKIKGSTEGDSHDAFINSLKEKLESNQMIYDEIMNL